MSTPTEQWLPVHGYESLYHVSNMGRVWALRSQRILACAPNSHGYPQVSLCKDGARRNYRVHKLVAALFCANGAGHPNVQVNHKDGDKTNNRADNLEWVTASYNTLHAYDHGKIGRGEDHVRARLTNDQVREIRVSDLSERKAAILYGVASATIGYLRRGITYKSIK